MIVSICSLRTFWFKGIMGSWGVIQAALLQSKPKTTSTSTVSFVGTLGLACVVAFGLFGVHLMRLLGARITTLLGVFLLSAARSSRSFTTSNVGGLFGTWGAVWPRCLSLLHHLQHHPDAILCSEIRTGDRHCQVGRRSSALRSRN